MKIEFLNFNKTEARLIRGWLTKEIALVHRDGTWYFTRTNTLCGDNIAGWIESKRIISPWEKVRALPCATIVVDSKK